MASLLVLQERKTVYCCRFAPAAPPTHLTGDTGGDDDNVSSGEGSLEASLSTLRPCASISIGEGSGGVGVGWAVTQVGGNAGGSDDVVAAEGGDVRGQLAKERKRLSDASSSTEDGNLSGRESRASEHTVEGG